MPPEGQVKMSKRNRNKYKKEFKVEAVRMVIEQGRTVNDVAEGLGIHPGVLQRWKKEFGNNGLSSFPGYGNLTPAENELRKLRRELDTTRQERDILKKALAYFAKSKG